MNYTAEWQDECDEFEMNDRILRLDRDIDILVSHVPPMGILDNTLSGTRIGCKSLREAILGVSSAFEPEQVIRSPHFEKLTHHFYGHCHEARGMEEHEVDGRKVKFMNVAETYGTLDEVHGARVAFHSK